MSRDELNDDLDSLDGIAIVGMAGRFPGAGDVDELWRNLRSGVESIVRLSDEELETAGVPPALYRRSDYVRAAGVLADADRFDAAFFGFTPREAELLDPQHRLFLECAAHALDDAGYDPRRFAGRIALFGGASVNGYLVSNLLPNRGLVEELGGKLPILLMNEGDFLCTRVSYKLDLRGPSALVGTACSTALAAVHLACQSLLTGECELALAGGVSVAVPREGYLYRQGGILASDGHCRAFDARATGSVGGSGVGLVVLKRLAEALAEGDTIRAVIRGSAMNNDGSSKVGFTAPSVRCQAEAIAEALSLAGLEPADLSYVEAHGSGTPLGDQIEVEALNQVFGRGAHPGPCALGSVKTNLGHLNSAAGAAGLMKTVLALEHREIPPSLHFERPNPEIAFDEGPFQVARELTPWQTDGAPRRAGVSSFGLGGTNVHVVLEEAPPRRPSGPSRPRQLVQLSARSESALDAACQRLAEHLEAHPQLPLADVAYTLRVGRQQQRRRRALVAADGAAALAALRQGRWQEGVVADASRPVIFLFPGLGDHYLGMTRGLYESEPVFRRELDRATELLAEPLGVDVRSLLFAGDAASGGGESEDGGKPDLKALLRRGGGEASAASRELDRTLYAQPALFAVEHALARLLEEWGLSPRGMIGYSLGEYVAATLAGVLELPDALALVAGRARLIEELPPGAMLAVPLPASEVEPLLTEGVALAATNGPNLSVVGGPEEAVAGFQAGLGDEVACLRLTTTHAFHTPMLEPAADELTALARSLTLRPPRIPYLSNVTGTWITEAQATDPGYWARHMCAPLRFAEGLGELVADPRRILLEVGPGATLTTLVRQHPDHDAEQLALPTVRHPSESGSDLGYLLRSLGRLWLAGVEIDETGFWAGEERHRLSLPPYPFERRRYWIDPPRRGEGPEPPAATDVPLKEPDPADWFYAPAWTRTPPAGLGPSAAGGPPAAGRWLLFLDPVGLGEGLARRLRDAGHTVWTVTPGESFAAGDGGWTLDPAAPQDYLRLVKALTAEGELPGRIVHLWSLTPETVGEATGEAAELTPDSFDAAQERGLLSLLFLARALAEGAPEAAVRLGVVANRLHDVLGGETVDPAKATLLGLARVLPQELAGAAVTTIDVALPEPGSPREEELLACLVAELTAGAESTVAYRGGHRWVGSFQPVKLAPAGEPAPRLRPGGIYLVSDASQELGRALAESLLRATGGKLALAVPTDPSLEAPGLSALEELAAEVGGEVAVLRADLADREATMALVEQVRERWGGLHGVLHTASSFAGGLVQLKNGAGDLPGVTGAQGKGALHLVQALDRQAPAQEALAEGETPPFLLLCSSSVGVTGGLGQADLAAAGTFLDALAAHRAGRGGGWTASLAWGPFVWEEWALPGMMGDAGVEHALHESLERVGITAQEAGEVLLRALAQPLPALVVSPRDLPTVMAQTAAVTAASLLAEVSRRTEVHARGELSTPYRAPETEAEETLAGIWQGLFGIDGIGADDSFFELGGHSLLGIQLITHVRRAFGVELVITELFDHPTVASLAARIQELREGPELSAEELERLLSQVEELSSAETEELLRRQVEATSEGAQG